MNKYKTQRSHFINRGISRGLNGLDIGGIWDALYSAIQNNRTDIVQLTYADRKRKVYKFRCEQGVKYAICSLEGIPVTIYTTHMAKARGYRGGKR